MKFSINFLDEICLELSLARRPNGQWVVRGVFPTFLERPGKPHLSLFTEKQFDLHFTANRGRQGEMRRKLVKVSAETANKFADRATEAMVRHHAAALLPADLSSLAEDGWSVHLAHWAALARWLAPYCKPGAALRIDDDTLGSIVFSICRHWVSPRALASLDGWVAYPLLRWRDDDVQVRFLFHYPQDISVPDQAGVAVRVIKRGWYFSDPLWPAGADLGIPADKLARLSSKVEALLARFPRRTRNACESPPHFASLIFGMYAQQLLELSLALAVQKAEASRTRDVREVEVE
ncbi:MAG TPA: hypothetical protein VNW92_06880 [Polyangiaceae bacterium]|jgi:hypothetical protein|nr:hypothetical protein [Polyangiaceae bacterium]